MAKGRKTGGRIAGVSLNKGTAEIKALAQQYGPDILKRLARLAGLLEPKEPGSQSDITQLGAMRELLDRGYGKAAQPQAGPDGEGNPIVEIIYRWGNPVKPDDN